MGSLHKRAGESDIDGQDMVNFLTDLPGGPDRVPDAA